MSSPARSRTHFVVAVVVLAGSAVFMQAAASRGLLQVRKLALPLRLPLEEFNRGSLSPWVVTSAGRLSPETEEELGTKHYLNWTLQGPPVAGSPGGLISLNVSFYTGLQDQVPHVPEECFIQGAFTQASDDTVEMKFSRMGERADIRRLSFVAPRRIGTRTFVYYTICVNGEFLSNRQWVRARMADPRDTHLYYSKVEVGIQAGSQADLSQLDRTAEQVLDRVLGELKRSHWPLRGWERGGPPAEPAARV
jgi:hypothetical protein